MWSALDVEDISSAFWRLEGVLRSAALGSACAARDDEHPLKATVRNLIADSEAVEKLEHSRRGPLKRSGVRRKEPQWAQLPMKSS